jgi:hypothetical protein
MCNADTGPFADAFVARLEPAQSGAASLVSSTYLGGGGDDYAYGVAVDGTGAAYVTGSTVSPDFPATAGAHDQTCGTDGNCNPTPDPFGGPPVPSPDAFVAKIAPGATAVAYATYLGGSGIENQGAPLFPRPLGAARGAGITVDSTGAAYLTGSTNSPDFPTTEGAYDQTCGTDGNCSPTTDESGETVVASNAFVTKLTPDGVHLSYSTFLGGSGASASCCPLSEVGETGRGIAVDAGGSAYVTGSTNSPNFPIEDAFQAANGGCRFGRYPCAPTTFVAKLDPSQAGPASLVYSSYLGGSGSTSGAGGGDDGADVAVDAAGDLYVTGRTTSNDFPTTANAIQPDFGPGQGVSRAFVTRISSVNPAPRVTCGRLRG